MRMEKAFIDRGNSALKKVVALLKANSNHKIIPENDSGTRTRYEATSNATLQGEPKPLVVKAKDTPRLIDPTRRLCMDPSRNEDDTVTLDQSHETRRAQKGSERWWYREPERKHTGSRLSAQRSTSCSPSNFFVEFCKEAAGRAQERR
jgi:hypothetical protein